ncbi:hypothetical protein [Haladaptatus pallidirubidus]|nr:hypothetical protein [Haladaptatus pallidirubidus]
MVLDAACRRSLLAVVRIVILSGVEYFPRQKKANPDSIGSFWLRGRRGRVRVHTDPKNTTEIP